MPAFPFLRGSVCGGEIPKAKCNSATLSQGVEMHENPASVPIMIWMVLSVDGYLKSSCIVMAGFFQYEVQTVSGGR